MAVRYDPDLHAVEYAAGKWMACNALDQTACINMAEEVAAYENDPTATPGPFDGNDAPLVVNIEKTVINWPLIGLFLAGLLMAVAGLKRG
ncbi:hypothetical protein [Thalassospira marina]|uniref:Uncharacterized protein n=1 Tax=Thalassospira marina TaxID=2048283 RepID=A0A2N3KTS4_9PROT|nr:hypothetical protein [Thalassospira marina]AUG55732.1 hypothetical protein CSC3H3_23075 [Thalassospira marina]PKR53873.1 hypothetical protein COO20_12765 [Thalassospira marina]